MTLTNNQVGRLQLLLAAASQGARQIAMLDTHPVQDVHAVYQEAADRMLEVLLASWTDPSELDRIASDFKSLYNSAKPIVIQAKP